MKILRYVLALILQAYRCTSILEYLDQSLDITDWCIVYHNDIEIPNISLLANLPNHRPTSFVTPDSFNCVIEHETMLLFDHVDPNGIKTVLDQVTQYQLMHNYFVILTDNELTRYSLLEYERALSIRTSILVFEGYQKEDFIIYEIVGTATLDHKMSMLGQLFQVNLENVVSKTRRNSNLNGITVTATYNHLPPFCIVNEDQVNGTFFDLIKTIGNVLNFTVNLQKPSKGNESWGKVVNGTIVGMLGEIYQGVVDTSIAGFAVTEERYEFVSFSPGIFKTATRGFIRKPKDTDFSFIYHIGQFLPTTWIFLLTFYALCLLFIFITFWRLPTSLWNASKNSIQVVSKAIISMGNTVKKSSISTKIGSFATLLSCMLIFIHYRAQMNAALNVKITNLPVNSWEDIYSSKTPVLTSLGGTNENYFSSAPKGSILRKIYDDIITQIDQDKHLSGTDKHLKGKEGLLEGRSVVFYNEQSYMSMPEYPCEFTDIPALKNPYYSTLPFHKDSPIKDIINEVIFELHLHGVVERIWEKYQATLSKEESCHEPTTVLSYNQLMLPNIILLGGLILSVIICAIELISK